MQVKFEELALIDLSWVFEYLFLPYLFSMVVLLKALSLVWVVKQVLWIKLVFSD